MASKFDGRCPFCDGLWSSGAMIYFAEGHKGYYCSPQCVQCDLTLGSTPAIQTGTPAVLTPQIESIQVEAAYERGFTAGWQAGRRTA